MPDEPVPVPRRWREDAPAESAAARAVAGPRRIFLGTFLLLLVAGAVATVLFWAGGKPPTYLAPLRVAAARSLAPPPTAGDLDALSHGGYFAAVGDGAGGGERGTLRVRLDALRNRPAGESLIVYLSGHATASGGRVFLVPADARPGDRADGLPLRDVLEALRDAPALHKLLVLDVMWSADDVAGSVADEAAAVEDPRRLVLCACSPGQTAHALDGTGRSAFGYYFEDGLRGWAAPAGAGRVRVEELAQFLRARVDRWAQRNRATRQTPMLLGSADDFPLAVVPGGEPAAHVEPPAAAPYPDWLRDAWKERDEWRQGSAYREAPAEFRRLEEVLLAAEADWRGGLDADHIRRDRLSEVERLQDRLRQVREVARPEPQSLALAASLGARPDPALADALREVLRRPAAPAKPGEPDRAAAELAEKLKGKSHFEAARAAFDTLAGDAHPTPEKVRLLDAALAAEEARPRYVETLFLRRLADLSRQIGPSEWPEATVRRALEVVRRGERAAGRPQGFHGVADALERAAQQRHDAETLLFAVGYAPVEEAARLLTAAEASYAAVLDAEDAAEEASRALDDAAAFLPAYSAYLERLPDAERAAALGRRCQEAAGVAADLGRARAGGGVGDLRRLAALLGAALDPLRQPFTDEGLKRLMDEARRPDARPAVYREIDAVLATPYLLAEARAEVWGTAHDLGQRLSDETLDLDREEGRPSPTGAPTRGVPGEAAAWQREAAARALVVREAAAKAGEAPPRRSNDAPALWAWLAERYAYEAQDSGAEVFYAAASREYARAAGGAVPAPAVVRFRGPAEALDLTPDHRSATALIGVDLAGPVKGPAEVRLGVLTAESAWLEVVPDPGGMTPAPAGAATAYDLPIRVALRPGAGQSPAPPPRGFLLQARVNDRSFSATVPVALAAVRDRLEAFFSTDPKKPSAPLTDVRLRPVEVPERFYLYVRNPGDRPRAVRIELSAGERLLRGTTTLPPRETVLVKFPPPPAPPAAPPAVPSAATAPPPAVPARLDALDGPVAVRLYDTEKNDALVLRQDVRVAVAAPREYVRVTGVRYDPPGPATGGKNRLEVNLQAAAELTDPPCVARLIVPADDRAPGPPPAGTLSGELLPPGEALKLFAESLTPPPSGEGPAWVDIDGCERAFLYRVGYVAGGTVAPREDRDVALRLRAAPYAVSGKLNVRAEVDNAPTGSTLEISLGRVSGAGFEADATRKFPTARAVRVGFGVSADGALLFDGSIRDWAIDLEAAQVRGRRALRARLLDADGSIVRTALQTVILDDRKPADVQFVEVPALARQGTVLSVKAVGRADVAGVKEVRFFLGTPPADGKLPANVPTVAGVSLDTSGRTWGARLKLPADRKGPLDLGVEFVSNVGLSTFGRTMVELVDFDPEKAAPGSVRGVVMIGGRPQAGLDVLLSDEKGVVKQKVKSGADGSFLFEGVAPGKYRAAASKPGSASDRQGHADFTVEPGKRATPRIDLYLP